MSKADQKGWIYFEGIAPDGSPGQKFKLPTKTVLHFRTHGHESKFAEVFSIEPALANPTVIFEGLGREDFDGGLCYCGIPAVKYLREDVQVPVPLGMMFLVFMNNEFVIFEFRWEKMSELAPGYPQDHASRFKRKTWSRLSNS